MSVPRRYWPPVALLILAFLGFFILVVLDVDSLASREEANFVPLRADARIACAVAIILGAVWLVVLRGREYGARLAVRLARMDEAIRLAATAERFTDGPTAQLPTNRLHVVRGTAAVAVAAPVVDEQPGYAKGYANGWVDGAAGRPIGGKVIPIDGPRRP